MLKHHHVIPLLLGLSIWTVTSFAQAEMQPTLQGVLTNITTFPAAESEEKKPPGIQGAETPPNNEPLTVWEPLPPSATSLLVPPGTVVFVSLDQPINSSQNKVGESVSATVRESVFIGPYKVIPKGSTMSGQITHVNAKKDKEGHNPYIVVAFNFLKRPSDKDIIQCHATLIAYKNGLRGQDYVWRLPTSSEHQRATLQGALKGATSGILFNPIFGPLLGIGSSLIKTTIVDGFARGGSVRMKMHEAVSIAIDAPFAVPLGDAVTKNSVPLPPLPDQNPTEGTDQAAQPVTDTPASDNATLQPAAMSFRADTVEHNTGWQNNFLLPIAPRNSALLDEKLSNPASSSNP